MKVYRFKFMFSDCYLMDDDGTPVTIESRQLAKELEETYRGAFGVRLVEEEEEDDKSEP